MKIRYALALMALVLGSGCVSVSPTGSAELLQPDAILDVYLDGEHVGSLDIVEGIETRKEFEDFVTVRGERIGLGIELVAKNFSLRDTYGRGEVNVRRRWIDPKKQDLNRHFPQYPVFSLVAASTSSSLRFDSPFHIVGTADKRILSGYDLDTDEGWQFVWRFVLQKTKTEQIDDGNSVKPPGDERTP